MVERDEYLTEVARRLNAILPELCCDRVHGSALGRLLQVYQIDCADGFVINGDDDVSLMGYTDAALVLEALCPSPALTWKEWRREIVGRDPETELVNQAIEQLLARIAASPHVERVGPGAEAS